MPDPTVPICSRPSQFCNRSSGLGLKDDIDPPRMRLTPERRRARLRGRCLPKSWASAGAFSLLTPASKLAQY
jgi:hypothetical protein